MMDSHDWVDVAMVLSMVTGCVLIIGIIAWAAVWP